MEIYHYWYSLKQDGLIEDMRIREFRNYILIDGIEKEYTECRKNANTPLGVLDDYKYLGMTAGFKGYTKKI